MKPLIYFFGTLTSGFSTYPQDHTKKFFSDFVSKSKNVSQIVLHRKDNLLHYGYVRKISNNKYFGICLCVDCIYSDTKYLFEVFDDVFASMIKKGDILKINSAKVIEWATLDFVSETVAITEYSKQIVDLLNISERNSLPLPPVNFSVSINDCLDLSLEDSNDKIIDAIKRYSNLYIVKKESEIERVNSFHATINRKDDEIGRLNEVINKLKEEKSKISRQKKQFRNVIFLFLILVLCCIGLYFLYDNLTNTKGQLYDANGTIHRQTQVIQKKKEKISYLNHTITSLQGQLENEKNERFNIERKLEEVCSSYPFIVTNCTVSSTEFSFDYYTTEEKEITVTLKAVNDREVVTNTHTNTYYKGGGRKSFSFSHSLNSSYYYYVVLIYDGQIIAGKRW